MVHTWKTNSPQYSSGPITTDYSKSKDHKNNINTKTNITK